MGTKWILIALLAVLAFLRVSQPTFFKRWVRADIAGISEHPLKVSTLIFLWVSMSVFGATCLFYAGYAVHPLLLLAIPLFLFFALMFFIFTPFTTEGRRRSSGMETGTHDCIIIPMVCFYRCFSLTHVPYRLPLRWERSLHIPHFSCGRSRLFRFETTRIRCF